MADGMKTLGCITVARGGFDVAARTIADFIAAHSMYGIGLRVAGGTAEITTTDYCTRGEGNFPAVVLTDRPGGLCEVAVEPRYEKVLQLPDALAVLGYSLLQG